MLSREWYLVCLATLFVMGVAIGGGASDPQVGNVRAQQLDDGTKRVEVLYDLSGAPPGGATVSIAFSETGGSPYSIAPQASTLSGDIGSGVVNGTNRRILWQAASTLPADTYGTSYRAAVTAADPGGGGGDTITITLPGGVTMDLVYIPAGTFMMGSPTDERGRHTNEDLHQVTLTQGYYLGKYEVTQAQWQAVMGSNPASGYGVGDNYPVYNVSWDDICGGSTGSDCLPSSFIGRLNTLLGTNAFRLPTEAEWERAARGGSATHTPFSFDTSGNPDWDTECGFFPEAADHMWWCGNNQPFGGRPVGSKLPNSFGLFDMHGNLYEWVADWYETNLGTDPDQDPTGPASGLYRVFRGGFWGHYAQFCRSAFRNLSTPSSHHGSTIGFRLARSDDDLKTAVASNTGYSNLFTIDLREGTPPAESPTLTASVISSTQIDLSWTAVTGATGYKLYRDGSLIYNNTGRTKSDTGRASGTRYCYTVKAYNSSGDGEISSQRCATTEESGGACTYAISAGSGWFPFIGGTNHVSVTTDDGCWWRAEDNATWLSVDPSTQQTGAGLFSYTANLYFGDARSAMITIETAAGSVGSISVTQDAFEPETPFEPPVPFFTVSSTRVVPGQGVFFSNQSTNATTFDWNFGDGNHSSRQHPTHRYTNPGTYAVWLRVSNVGHPDPTPIGPVLIEVVQSDHTISGEVRDFDGGPIPWDGKVILRSTWAGGPSTRAFNFEAGDGSWQFSGMPSGVYRADVSRGVDALSVNCPNTNPVRTRYGFSYFLTVEDGGENFELQLDCGAPSPSAVLPDWMATCILSVADFIPCAGYLSASTSALLDFNSGRNAALAGDYCEATAYTFAAWYDTVTLVYETACLDQAEDMLGLMVACVGVPVGLAACDYFFDDQPLKTGESESNELMGLTPGVSVSTVSVRGETADISLQVESPHAFLLGFDGTNLVNKTGERGSISNIAGSIDLWLAEPSHVDRLTIENRGNTIANLTVTGVLAGTGVNHAAEFEVSLAPGSVFSSDLVSMVSSGMAEVRSGAGTVTSVGATSELVVENGRHILPATAHLEGAQGSSWRTDLVVANPGETAADFRLSFFVPGIKQPVVSSLGTLNGRGVERFSDVLETELEWGTGNGWLELVSSDPLLSVARTYSLSTEGTQGQIMPGLSVDDSDGVTSRIFSARKNSEFRTNLGLLNPTHSTQQFSLELFDDDGDELGRESRSLAPFEQLQINDIVRTLRGGTTPLSIGRVDVTTPNSGAISYGSMIDNNTNDPMTLIPFLGSEFFVPVVADTAGSHGSYWRTELHVHPSNQTEHTTLELTLLPSGENANMAIGPGEVLVLESVLSAMGSSATAGMVHVSASQNVTPYCRIFSVDAEGTRGQGVPVVGANSSQTIASGETGHLIGLQSDGNFRTNLAIQNYGSEQAELELELFGRGGGSLGRTSVTIPGRDYRQYNEFMTGLFGIDNRALARLEIRVSEGAMVGAYASLVDNQTNDGTFLPLMRTGESVQELSPLEKTTVSLTQRGCLYLSLAWSEVQNATGYRLERDDQVIYEGPNLRYDDEGVWPEQEFCYTVSAYDSVGVGPPSEELCVLAGDDSYMDRPLLTASALSSTEIRLEWTDVPGGSEFSLRRGEEWIYNGGDRFFTDSDLSPGTRYCYTVNAWNILCGSPFSEEQCVSTFAQPPLLQFNFDSDAVGGGPSVPDGLYLHASPQAIVRSSVGNLTQKPVEIRKVESGTPGAADFQVLHEDYSPFVEDGIVVFRWESLVHSNDGFACATFWVSAIPDGHVIGVGYGADGYLKSGGGSISQFQWVRDQSLSFELQIDLDLQVSSLFINGVPISNHQDLPFDEPMEAVHAVKMSGCTTNAQSIVIDNFELVRAER